MAAPLSPVKRAPRSAVPAGQEPGASLRHGGEGTRPKLPHEHDQSVGTTGDGAVPAVTRQGYRDVARGVQDTSRADEADEAYRKQKLPAPSAPQRARPARPRRKA
ncbi:MAG: hypothetical protein JSR59_12880 [Proteobacteria bacterium]|nr:hypothetical protein [Pseudomonadota bacterium]